MSSGRPLMKIKNIVRPRRESCRIPALVGKRSRGVAVQKKKKIFHDLIGNKKKPFYIKSIISQVVENFSKLKGIFHHSLLVLIIKPGMRVIVSQTNLVKKKE